MNAVTAIIAANATVESTSWYSENAVHSDKYKTPLPTAFSEYENAAYPRVLKRSDHAISPAPATSPISTRPSGPIQWLSLIHIS